MSATPSTPPPKWTGDAGSYGAARLVWFKANGATFSVAAHGAGKLPWYVRAPYIGGSGDFNLEDARGNLRRFGSRDAAQRIADLLNKAAGQ